MIQVDLFIQVESDPQITFVGIQRTQEAVTNRIARVRVCVCARVRACVRVRVQVHVYRCTCARVYRYACTCTCIDICVHACVCIRVRVVMVLSMRAFAGACTTVIAYSRAYNTSSEEDRSQVTAQLTRLDRAQIMMS